MNGALCGHLADGGLAAESDETEQWGSGTADGEPRYRNARMAALSTRPGAAAFESSSDATEVVLRS